MEIDSRTQGFLDENLGADAWKLFPLAGDASNRRYFRVVRDNQSWVLMKWDAFNPDDYPFLSVQAHFQKAGVRVPTVVGMDAPGGMLLLEDLGDLTLERRFWESQSQTDSMVFYRMAIEQICLIHNQASELKGPCTAFGIAFDTEKLLWEMNYGKEHLLKGLLAFPMGGGREQELEKVFLSICERLHAEPKRIAHRDYHSRNLMIKLDEMCVIDFQDARMGPVQYDLVSLLRDSYTDLSDEASTALINDYLEMSREYLPKNFSKEHFLRVYELQSIQRCFKACGSFASFLQLRQDRRYLKHLPPTLKRVAKALQHFPEYKPLADALVDSGSFEKNYESI